MPVNWPDEVDEIVAGDHLVMLAHRTPAGGVVLSPLSTFGLRDRAAGSVTVSSSIGASRKLERIRADPRVALAFHTRLHTRLHSRTSRPELVLVHGEAAVSAPIEDYPAHLVDAWGQVDERRATGRLWRRWLRVYDTRSEITVTAQRILVWPDLTGTGEPRVLGAATAAGPAPQTPPARGTAPRVDHRRAATVAERLQHVLLGWAGGDGLPCVVPVHVRGVTDRGLVLDTPTELPAGGRRAGLTAHSFTRNVLGQVQEVFTGWLEVSPDGRAVYAPHTRFGYRLPPSLTVYRLAVGFATRRGLRRAVPAGV